MVGEERPTKVQKSGRDFGSGHNSMVTIFVKDGQDGSESFTIHEHLLCNASPYFKTAFQGEFAQDGQKSLCLRDVGRDTMNHVVPWMYSGHLACEAGELDVESSYWVAARLNTFALTYQLSGLTEEAVALVKGHLDKQQSRDKSGALPRVDQIVEIYRESPASNLLRKFVIRLFGTELQSSWYDMGKLVKEYPQKCPQFAADLFQQLGDKIASLEYSNKVLRDDRDKFFDANEKAQQRIEELEDD